MKGRQCPDYLLNIQWVMKIRSCLGKKAFSKHGKSSTNTPWTNTNTHQMEILSLWPYKNKNGKPLVVQAMVLTFPSNLINNSFSIHKGPFSGLKQFLTVESHWKMMKNGFHFMLKALFVHEIFTFLSWRFCNVENRLDKKIMANFKVYDVKDRIKNSYNTLWPNIFKSKGNKSMKFVQLIKYSVRNIFLEK